MSDTCILIADDDPDIRAMLAELLEYEGYEVATASNGSEALAAIASRRPALLILDIWMPVLSGADLASAMQARGIDLPILVITAESNPGRLAERLGAEEYLQKPFELDALLASIHRLCPSVGSRRPSRGG